MRFRTKMMIIYSGFILLIALALGIWYQTISFNHYENNEYQNNVLLARQLSNQLDETIKPMEFVSNYLLSDMDVLSAIKILSNEEETGQVLEDMKVEAEKTIETRLQSYYLLSNFRRVIFFNQQGSVVANTNIEGIRKKLDVTYTDIEWIKRLQYNKGKPLLLGPHKDDWSYDGFGDVISSVKKIQGNNLGYIEVQKSYKDLEELIEIPHENLKVVAILRNGEFLYSNDTVSPQTVTKLHQLDKKKQGDYLNPLNNKEMLVFDTSEETGITFYIMEDLSDIRNQASYIVHASIAIALIFLLISVLFVYVASGFLSKPIKNLMTIMENTEISNLDHIIDVDDESHNEFKALNDAYYRLMTRLNESIIQEQRLSVLQLKAQYDLLQTQVNPHFIYNVLNVLSGRGMQSGDETICDMCSSLAGMLRYATNTKEAMATIEEEISYIEEYFYLLKQRYMHKLQYRIQIDPAIVEQRVPKVLLQQFVENSINHGYKNSNGTMYIEIIGYQKKNDWCIKIKDNGNGFDKAKQEEIQEKIHDFEENTVMNHQRIELEIGGMGLLNAYGRMTLLYDKQCIFEYGNNPDTGAYVIVGAPIEEKGE